MRKSIITLLLVFSAAALLPAADSVIFSGGYSQVSLKEGRETLTLSGGADVTVGNINLKADEISLSGTDYNRIECTGNIVVTDTSRGLVIRSGRVLYDRSAETLLISSYSEISDSVNEMEASAGAIYYDMNAEILQLQMRVRILKNTESGVLQASSENVRYDRNNENLVISGNASVKWKSDEYSAQVISIDLNNETLQLEGRIGGVVNG